MNLTFREPMGGYGYIIRDHKGDLNSVSDAEDALASAIDGLDISDDEKANLAEMIGHFCELREKAAAALIMDQIGHAAGITWRDVIVTE